MIKSRILKYSVLVLLIVLSVGCASNEIYVKFSQAGSAYSKALDGLLVSSMSLSIDAHSEWLLNDDIDKYDTYQEKVENASPGEVEDLKKNLKEKYEEEINNKLDKNNTLDEKTIKILNKLREHAKLLSRYFQSLTKLATSNASQEAANAANSLVGSVNSLGNEMRGMPIVNDQIRQAIVQIVDIGVSAAIRGKLKTHFENNKKILLIELNTQEKLLEFLSKKIIGDLEDKKFAGMDRLVRTPLVKFEPISLKEQDKWISNRRTMLLMKTTIDEMGNAKKAAKSLNDSFKKILQNDIELEDINTLVSDIESIITVVETLNQ